MPTFFQRPENALKRANEFIDVGKKQRALDALYDVIKSKKHRTWQKIHEPIMEKYLELCVELKKSHVAKEGLYQYKNICQQVNIKSLEDVVRKYLSMAEEKTEAARQTSHQTVIDVDDLDVIQTPENLLLSAVSGEDTQDRTDRAILTPWVKFLWESYRQCLDLLRNNSSVEKLYQDIAQQAFKFCLKYARKTEFRKLCDNLRTHLGHVYKHQHQQRAINLNNPESQAMHLETRLAQLDSAIQMELWQEAFKAVEDIHGLIALSKKPPKPSLMANYYQKLGLVFWKSGNHMFHACAWHRLFHLSREQRKNLSQEELTRLASRLMCATLAIPIPPARNQIDKVLELDDSTVEKQRRLTTLLGLQNNPSRSQLVKDLVKYNVVQYVHPELQSLYRWLEVEFHPLKLSSRVAGPLEFISKKDELSQYAPALQDIVITRLLKQVSQVYQTIEFSRLALLAPFASQFHMERVVVDAVKNLDLQVRIDHKTRSLSFGTDLCVSQKEDVPEGPYLQSMPSEQIRNQLTSMAQSLHKAAKIVAPQDLLKKEELRAHIVQSYRQTSKKDHQRILMRRQIIEERKEELENMNTARERQEHEFAEEQRRKQIAAEMERLEREAEEREKQRRLEEHKEIQRKAARERLEQLRSTALGAKVFANMDEEVIAELDADEIVAKQVEQLEKEKKEMQEKLRQQEKKVDYLERAKRQEEIPLLQKQYEAKKVQEQEFWEQQEKQKIEQMKADREIALQHRDRMSRMVEDKNAFLSRLKDARMSVYKEKLADFEKKLAEERKKRLAERKERRKEERRKKWIKEKEEEEQRCRDEALVRKREEEERLEEERRKKEEEEYEAKLKELEVIAEKQKQKDREIEEKERLRREQESRDFKRDTDRDWKRGERLDGDSPDRPKSAWRPRVQEGGWREREKAREESWKKPDGTDRDEKDRFRRGGDREDGVDTWRRGPAREERDGPARDDRGPAREEGTWRRGPSRDFDDRGTSDRDSTPWRRGAFRDRDDAGPHKERDGDEGGWRRGGTPRDREERGGWSRRDEDRGGSRGGWGRRDDRGGRDDDRWGRRDDRGGRDDERWSRREERGGRDDDRWGRRDDSREEGVWRRGPAKDDLGTPARGKDERITARDDRAPVRDPDDRGKGRKEDHDGGREVWRRGGGDRGNTWRDREAKVISNEDDRRPPEREKPAPKEEDEGWTTVKH